MDPGRRNADPVRMTSAPPPAEPSVDPSWEPPTPPPGPPARTQLRRSSTDRMIGGVCGGLADYSGIDPLLWRIGFVALAFAGGSGVLVYLLLWLLMPHADRQTAVHATSLSRDHWNNQLRAPLLDSTQ